MFGIACSEQRSNLQSSEQVSGVGPIPIHPPDRSTRLRPVDQCFRDVLARNKREDKSNFSQAGFEERGSEEQMLRDWLLSETESEPPDSLRELLRDLLLKHRNSTCPSQEEDDTIVPSARLPGPGRPDFGMDKSASGRLEKATDWEATAYWPPITRGVLTVPQGR